MIDKIDILKKICKIDFYPEEEDKLKENLKKKLDFIEGILEVDTENVKEMHRPFEYRQRLREDLVEESLEVSEVLKNTPHKKYGFLLVNNKRN